jgi:hypothetical protein
VKDDIAAYCPVPQSRLFVDRACWPRDAPMSETLPAIAPRFSQPLVIIAAAVGALFAGTVALWAHYGTAVFYEMIVAGIAACF